MDGRTRSRCVFVGNIPYDATEQQLVEIFQTVGKVVSFRLVHDRDTGKPKGYGFCEFRDPETAKSAIRNLDGHDFHGRSLRVDFADDDKPLTGQSNNKLDFDRNRPNIGAQAPPDIIHGIDFITQLVKSLTREQLIEILVEMKKLIRVRPDAAKQLLLECPQVAQALLQIQVLFGLVRPQDITSLQIARPTTGVGISNNPTPDPSSQQRGPIIRPNIIAQQQALLQAQLQHPAGMVPVVRPVHMIVPQQRPMQRQPGQTQQGPQPMQGVTMQQMPMQQMPMQQMPIQQVAMQQVGMPHRPVPRPMMQQRGQMQRPAVQGTIQQIPLQQMPRPMQLQPSAMQQNPMQRPIQRSMQQPIQRPRQQPIQQLQPMMQQQSMQPSMSQVQPQQIQQPHQLHHQPQQQLQPQPPQVPPQTAPNTYPSHPGPPIVHAPEPEPQIPLSAPPTSQSTHSAPPPSANQAQPPLPPSQGTSQDLPAPPTGAPVSPAAAQSAAEIASQLPPEQQQILKEVLKLSPAQIKQLPQEVQQQVFQLQQQMAGVSSSRAPRAS